jgi:hypothetical protein
MRRATIDEAIGWPSGAGVQIETLVYDTGQHRVGVAKPGKEAQRVGDLWNPNDMLPIALEPNGQRIPYVPGFGELFRQLFQVYAAGPDQEALQILGCLAFRNAYLLDHVPDENGHLRYRPPEDAMALLETRAPVITSGPLVLPIRTYIYILEMLALNEDTKYFTLRDSVDDRVGRPNNLKTYVHVIAACLGIEHPFEVGGQLIRGVAPYGIQKTRLMLRDLG